MFSRVKLRAEEAMLCLPDQPDNDAKDWSKRITDSNVDYNANHASLPVPLQVSQA